MPPRRRPRLRRPGRTRIQPAVNDASLLRYCPDIYHYARRRTRVVMVGRVAIGGDNPVRVQSMLTSDTRDTEACVAEALGLVAAGCEIVRITAQTRVYAANVAQRIRRAIVSIVCDDAAVSTFYKFATDNCAPTGELAAHWIQCLK